MAYTEKGEVYFIEWVLLIFLLIGNRCIVFNWVVTWFVWLNGTLHSSLKYKECAGCQGSWELVVIPTLPTIIEAYCFFKIGNWTLVLWYQQVKLLCLLSKARLFCCVDANGRVVQSLGSSSLLWTEGRGLNFCEFKERKIGRLKTTQQAIEEGCFVFKNDKRDKWTMSRVNYM